MTRLKSRVTLVVFFLLLPLLSYFWLWRILPIPPRKYRPTKSGIDELPQEDEKKTWNNSPTENTTCRYPRLDPWPTDTEVRALLGSPPPPLHCNRSSLVYDLDFQTSEIVHVGGNQSNWTNCCYKAIFRGTDNDDFSQRLSECFPIRGPRMRIPYKHEFLAVFCDFGKIKGQIIQVLAHTPLKPHVEARLRPLENEEESVNVVILGLEGTSHMEFKRALPKVLKYLVKNLSALWFEGYTKVGLNTFPNILAFTTGLHPKEAEDSCVQDDHVDDCPFVWKKFAQRGYRTLFAEDAPIIAIFNYALKGFLRQPVDYYIRPLSNVADSTILNGPSSICWGPHQSLDILLKYMKSLTHTLGRDRRYIQLVWPTRLTHGNHLYASLAEDSLLEYMQWMQSEGHLNRTVFIFLSDHGIREGDFRGTSQGRIEDSMPFFYAVFPDWFRRKYPAALANFRLNRERLVTLFDGHQTLLDLLHLSNIQDKAIGERSRELGELDPLPRGISLFLPIPKRRTCQMAGIADPFCICDERVPANDSAVLEVVNFAVSHLNQLLFRHPSCATLSLKTVLSASTSVVEEEDGQDVKRLYHLSFITSPSNASFDATLAKRKEGIWNTFFKPAWSVSGPISRTNLYKNQSYCVDKLLKNYCYCIK